MNARNKQFGLLAACGLGMMTAGVASASPITMHFDSINTHYAGGNRSVVLDSYYDGGCAKNGFATISQPKNSYCVASGGPNYGVEWGAGAEVAGAPNGTYGNVSDEPSPPNVLSFPGLASFPPSNDNYLNVAAGFTGDFSLAYQNAFSDGAITLYDGLNGTGDVVTTLTLPATSIGCGSEIYSCWQTASVSFSGIARSADFSGVSHFVNYFDDVSLNVAATSVPEPAELGMFGFGFGLIGILVALRRRTSARRA